ncbi:MAG: precorrin-6y C5,15-methyltransferase (decarboxylating) subunit CbiE [Thermodesulfobacteriota bacterium]
MLKTIHVIGLGLGRDDLKPAALRLVEAADVLAGGRRQLEAFPEHAGRKIFLAGNLSEWLDRVAEAAAGGRVVVLASGDPNFYGVASRLIEHVGPENVRLHPNVTLVQAAFARLKETWVGVTVISLHGRDEEALLAAARMNDRLAVYTDPVNTPARIARLLLERGQTAWRMCVLEDLGGPNSRISYFRLHEVTAQEFSPLNLVVLWRKDQTAPLVLGTPDEEFVHEGGLITKAEIRAVALARLGLGPNQTLWDLGAGCGSVGIEATLLLPGGRVIAVEREPERVRQIEANRTRFGVANLAIIQGEMPEALSGLPGPDRVFVGGGGPALEEIIRTAAERLNPGGVLVTAAVKMGSLETAKKALAAAGLKTDLIQVQVSRGAALAGDDFLKALNPVWLVRGVKSG